MTIINAIIPHHQHTISITTIAIISSTTITNTITTPPPLI
jgi:hypothetical protein